MCCQGLMYCQGSVRTTGQADIWPGKTVIPLLLWCVVFVFGLVRFVRPCVMTKELFYSYPSMRSRKAMPVCYFDILQCAAETQCQSTVHNGQI